GALPRELLASRADGRDSPDSSRPGTAMSTPGHPLVLPSSLLLSSLLCAQAHVPELEPNDTPATAQVVALGVQIEGSLAAGEQDWFRFSTAGGNVPLYLSGAGATAVDAQMALFDGFGATMLAFDDDARGVLPALNLDLAAGTYLLRISGFSATSSGAW